MTDPADYTARIRAKGLDTTGITEQLAAEMYRNKGRHYLAIVELRVDETHEKADDSRKVDLVLTQVEPATTSDLEDHLRELTRVGYLNRRQTDGQLAIDDTLGTERTVADVMASGQRHAPHPFLPDDASKDEPICDVCGGIEASAVHSTQNIFDDPDDGPGDDQPGDEPDTEDGDRDDESADEADDVDDPAAAEGLIQADEQPDDPWAYDQPDPNPAHVPGSGGSGVGDPFTPTPAA